MRRAGFSLVETVVALGIVATVLMAALGLMPVGISLSHDAEREVAAAKILDYIGGRCATPIPAEGFYFSNNGSLLPRNGNGIVYKATVKLAGGVALPGLTDRTLRSVVIEIRDCTPNWRMTRTIVLPP